MMAVAILLSILVFTSISAAVVAVVGMGVVGGLMMKFKKLSIMKNIDTVKRLKNIVLAMFILSSFNSQVFANGAPSGDVGVILQVNGGSKTLYNVYSNWSMSCNGYTSSSNSFNSRNLGNINTLVLNGAAIVGWSDNSDWLAGQVEYRIWLSSGSRPTSPTGTFNVGGYGSACSTQDQYCFGGTNNVNRVAYIDNQSVNLISGLAPGVYSFEIISHGQLRYSCGSWAQQDNAAVTASFTVNPTVTFNANGGTGTMTNENVNYNTATALTANSFSITGGTFNGWNTAANGSGTAYANSANVTLTSNTTLYAQWLPTITVTVGSYTYNGSAQGPTAVTGNTGGGTVTWSYAGTAYDGSTYSASATKPTKAGIYTATASVTAAGNYLAATSSATAFAIAKVPLTITAANQSVCYGTLATSVTGAGSYTPTGFVNSETSAVIGGSATYTTTYTASTAAGTGGVTITPVTSSLTASNYSFSAATGTITINSLPSAPTLSVTATPTCSTANGTVSITSSTSGLTFSSDASSYSTYSPFTVAGGAAYSITAKNANGCVSTASTGTMAAQPVTPNSTITAPASVCASATGITASVPVSAGGSYSWSISGGSITAGAGTNQITITANASGSITLNCTVTSSGGCISGGSQNTSISIGSPISTITASNVCSNSTGNIASVPTTSGGTYSWSISGGTITAGSGTNQVTYTAGASGTVVFNCTITGSGCSSGGSQNQTVTIYSLPTISGTLTVCGTGTTTLTGSGTAAASTPWSSASTSYATVSGASTTGTVTGVAPGTSNITYTDNHGCTSAASTVTVYALPTISGTLTICGTTGTTSLT